MQTHSTVQEDRHTQSTVLLEKNLRDYYRKLHDIKIKRLMLGVSEKNVTDIRKTLRHVHELIPIRETASKYKAISGSYYVNDLNAQKYCEITSTIEQFRNYLIVLSQRQFKLKMQIMYLESEVDGISFALDRLDPVDRTICENSYGLQGKSNIQTGSELNMDEKAIRYRRKKIISQLVKVIELEPNHSVITE